jgi:2-polyprenyl-3-methyl-5-hydroxy-6-metoxy-1,4-benzoquinol methylase
MHRALRTGNRRYELERFYLEHGDVWDYRNGPGERAKFEVLLSQVLQHVTRRGTALDVGCSIGVFSAMLARHFGSVVALDFSTEAFRQAPELARIANLRTVIADARAFKTDETFDVVVCAGILSYFPDSDVEKLLDRVVNHLSEGGALIIQASSEEVLDRLGSCFCLIDKVCLPNPWGFVAVYRVAGRL